MDEQRNRAIFDREFADWLPQLHALRTRHRGLERWAVDVDPLAILFSSDSLGDPKAVSLYAIPSSTPGALSSELSMRFGLRGPSLVVTTGCTSSTDAIGTAAMLLRAGRADRVLAGGPAVDPDYAARRRELLVVAVECAVAGSTCFCASMGTGPEVTMSETSNRPPGLTNTFARGIPADEPRLLLHGPSRPAPAREARPEPPGEHPDPEG